jgi:hypothetical protein
MYVVESFVGGVYSVIRDVALHLPADRFELLLVHSTRPETPPAFRDDFDRPNIRLLYLPMDSPANYFRSVARLVHLMRAERPDVVHLHSSKAGFLGRLAAALAGSTGVLYSPHGYSFLRRDLGPAARLAFYFLEWLASRLGGRVVAVSQGELTMALRYSPGAVLIDNFVSPGVYGFQASPTAAVKTVGTLGRVAPQRDPGLFDAVARAFPEVRFVWIGSGPEELLRRLGAPNITVTGFLPQAKAWEELSKLHVYIHTSLWEGMPMAVLEAMALAKPVVATDVIGNRDIIRHLRTGILTRTGREMIRWVGTLAASPSLRLRLGQAGRLHVMRHHDLAGAVAKYVRLYEAAASSACSRPRRSGVRT